MDLHVLIVIACVFLGSLFSLLFINQFFRGKTFDEVAAEKKLLAEKLYGPPKVKRQQQQRKTSNKKEMKKEKKLKSKETAITNLTSSSSDTITKDNDIESQNESDVHSETQSENSPAHHKKGHVEFLEPEIIEDVGASNVSTGKQSGTLSGNSKKEKQRKLSNSSKSSGGGILLNKSEAVVIKETLIAEPLNHFDIKPPKDVLELKKHSKENLSSKEDHVVDGKSQNTENKQIKDVKVKEIKKSIKISKNNEKEKEKDTNQQEFIVHVKESISVKEIKHDEKTNKSHHHHHHDSPKIQNNKQQKKKKSENNLIIDQINGADVISVDTLISIFNQAELNRNEIQILIDYLLNKQQDTSAHHSEWSDDIVQKLKKQLNEKEKALQEEQEASAGIQAKLRELRTEINSERVHFNATSKIYMDKLQAKDLEIANLTQEIQNLNEKLNVERQQFQAIHHEKQANSQELLAQIQQLSEHNSHLQNEIVHLQMIANASHQTTEETKQKTNEIIQQQNTQILALEQKLSETKDEISRLQYDLQLSKMAENEKENTKVELRNLQNALDSTKAELNLAQSEVKDNKQNYDILNKQIEQYKRNYEQTKIALSEIQLVIGEKDKKLTEYEISLKLMTNKEDDLMRQIKEQKDKNNDLRTKNWKLVEALQKAETNAVVPSVNRNLNNLVTQSTTATVDEQRIRELFQRLFPESVKNLSGSSLTITFDQWIELVVSNHIKQFVNNNTNNNLLNRDNSIKNNNNNNNNNNNTHIHNEENNHSNNNNNSNYKSNHIDDASTTTTTTTEGSCSSNNITSSSNHKKDGNDDGNNDDIKKIILENYQLKATVEQLTSIVTKTENLLTNLEKQARDQEAHNRDVIQAKQKEIYVLENLLKNLNGQAI